MATTYEDIPRYWIKEKILGYQSVNRQINEVYVKNKDVFESREITLDDLKQEYLDLMTPILKDKLLWNEFLTKSRQILNKIVEDTATL